MLRSLERWCRRLVGLSLALVAFELAAQPVATYSVAVVPLYGVVELHRNWLPVMQRLQAETGIAFELRIGTSIPRFESEFLKGGPDFVFLNPYHAVMANRAQGYLPLVRDRTGMSGVLVVHKDSDIQSLRDLDNHDIAFPAPNAFAASLYMRALLTEQVGVRFTARYLGSHSNVIRNVARKSADAGGTIQTSVQGEMAQVRGQLRVIYQSPETAAHPLVAHPRVPPPVVRAVIQALLRMAHDEEGRAMLRGIGLPDPVLADYARDYQPLERLRLDKYLIIEKD